MLEPLQVQRGDGDLGGRGVVFERRGGGRGGLRQRGPSLGFGFARARAIVGRILRAPSYGLSTIRPFLFILAGQAMREQYLSDFDFELPQELIAQYPLENRTASRLLHVTRDVMEDGTFTDIEKYLNDGRTRHRRNARHFDASREQVPEAGHQTLFWERRRDGHGARRTVLRTRL